MYCSSCPAFPYLKAWKSSKNVSKSTFEFSRQNNEFREIWFFLRILIFEFLRQNNKFYEIDFLNPMWMRHFSVIFKHCELSLAWCLSCNKYVPRSFDLIVAKLPINPNHSVWKSLKNVSSRKNCSSYHIQSNFEFVYKYSILKNPLFWRRNSNIKI